MKSILEQKGKLKGKKVLLRLSLNVPIDNGLILSDFKIKKSQETIDFLKKEEAKILILAYGKNKDSSLEPVFDYLKKIYEIQFVRDILDEKNPLLIEKMEEGGIMLFENLKKYDEETKNDELFAKKIASLGDFYINEAFPDSHREYASIISVPKYLDSYFGFNFIKEVEFLSSIKNKEYPFLIILGGNKLKTKLPFVKNFLEVADEVFLGGALANDFFKLKGLEVGRSIISKEELGLEKLIDNKKIILPKDVVVLNSRGSFEKKVTEISEEDVILDLGSETMNILKEKIQGARFILWNGPLGDYTQGFSDATFGLIKNLANSSAEVVVGGGDSVYCIEKLSLLDSFDFVSTGGGAMLQYLIDGTLVGMEAIQEN